MTDEHGRRGRRLLLTFGAGLAVGVTSTILAPKLLRPYLPSAIVGERAKLEGVVRAKQVETDRLLLTIPTERGTILATFSRDIADIDLLVQKGDSVTLEMQEYTPFVDNPRIASVKAQLEGEAAERTPQPSAAPPTATPDTVTPAQPLPGAPSDTPLGRATTP